MEEEKKFESLSQLLSRLLAEKNISQRLLAKLSGVNRGYINQLVKGKVSNIGLDTAKALAKGLGINPCIFMGYDIEKQISTELAKIPLEAMIDQYRLIMPVSIPFYDTIELVDQEQPVRQVSWDRADLIGSNTASLAAFLVRGDFMEPHLKNGDFIIVDKDKNCVVGNIVIYLLDDGLHCGKLTSEQGRLIVKNSDRHELLHDTKAFARVIRLVRKL